MTPNPAQHEIPSCPDCGHIHFGICMDPCGCTTVSRSMQKRKAAMKAGAGADPAQELERIREIVRRVRDEMLADGYHRPNELILSLDEVLGEEHGY